MATKSVFSRARIARLTSVLPLVLLVGCPLSSKSGIKTGSGATSVSVPEPQALGYTARATDTVLANGQESSTFESAGLAAGNSSSLANASAYRLLGITYPYTINNQDGSTITIPSAPLAATGNAPAGDQQWTFDYQSASGGDVSGSLSMVITFDPNASAFSDGIYETTVQSGSDLAYDGQPLTLTMDFSRYETINGQHAPSQASLTIVSQGVTYQATSTEDTSGNLNVTGNILLNDLASTPIHFTSAVPAGGGDSTETVQGLDGLKSVLTLGSDGTLKAGEIDDSNGTKVATLTLEASGDLLVQGTDGTEYQATPTGFTQISGASPSPSGSATSSPAASPTPTATPTPAATPTGTPAPTPTPTAIACPTPDPAATPAYPLQGTYYAKDNDPTSDYISFNQYGTFTARTTGGMLCGTYSVDQSGLHFVHGGWHDDFSSLAGGPSWTPSPTTIWLQEDSDGTALNEFYYATLYLGPDPQ